MLKDNENLHLDKDEIDSRHQNLINFVLKLWSYTL